MEIKALTCGAIGTNSYVLINNGEAIVIDPAEYTPIRVLLDMEGVKAKAVLLTHGHFDHITAVSRFIEDGAEVYCHEGDSAKCRGEEMSEKMQMFRVKPFQPSHLLQGGECLEIIGLKIKVIHTPGHSKGSVCYIIEDKIFSGDTIFFQCYGRYDFYDGSFSQLKSSIDKIFDLEGDYMIFCGHGESTKLSRERLENEILWS